MMKMILGTVVVVAVAGFFLMHESPQEEHTMLEKMELSGEQMKHVVEKK